MTPARDPKQIFLSNSQKHSCKAPWKALLEISPGMFSWRALLEDSPGEVCRRLSWKALLESSSGKLFWKHLLESFPGKLSWKAHLEDSLESRPGRLSWKALLEYSLGKLSRKLSTALREALRMSPPQDFPPCLKHNVFDNCLALPSKDQQ